MVIRLSKWNGPKGATELATGAASGAAAGVASRAPEAAGRMASVGDEPVEVARGGACGTVIMVTESAGAAVAGVSGIVAENIEPTAVVPKNWGTDGARSRGGRLRRAASDAGIDPELSTPEAEADMVVAAATLGFWARRRLGRGGSRFG
jgi:hypothetical protein